MTHNVNAWRMSKKKKNTIPTNRVSDFIILIYHGDCRFVSTNLIHKRQANENRIIIKNWKKTKRRWIKNIQVDSNYFMRFLFKSDQTLKEIELFIPATMRNVIYRLDFIIDCQSLISFSFRSFLLNFTSFRFNDI